MAGKSIVLDILGIGFRINCSDHRVIDLLDLLWEPFVVAQTQENDARIVCDVLGTAEQWRLRYTPDQVVLENWALEGNGLWSLMMVLRYALVTRARYERDDVATVHAACVASNEGGVLLPGRNASGKTTFALALLELGYSYVTDDVCPIDLRAGTVTPFPKPLGLRDAGDVWRHLKPLWNPPAWVPESPGAWLLPPTAYKIAEGVVPIRVVVFPRFEAERVGPAEIERLSPARAVALLGEQIDPLEAEMIALAAGLMRRVPAVLARYGRSTSVETILERATC